MVCFSKLSIHFWLSGSMATLWTDIEPAKPVSAFAPAWLKKRAIEQMGGWAAISVIACTCKCFFWWTNCQMLAKGWRSFAKSRQIRRLNFFKLVNSWPTFGQKSANLRSAIWQTLSRFDQIIYNSLRLSHFLLECLTNRIQLHPIVLFFKACFSSVIFFRSEWCTSSERWKCCNMKTSFDSQRSALIQPRTSSRKFVTMALTPSNYRTWIRFYSPDGKARSSSFFASFHVRHADERCDAP